MLRAALAEILAWYDTFDEPGADVCWLTERDFERYRTLAKILRPQARRVG